MRSATAQFPPTSPVIAGRVARARPEWITPELIAQTLATWQPHYPNPLTDEEAIEMLLTVSNLYRFLAEPDGEINEHKREEEKAE